MLGEDEVRRTEKGHGVYVYGTSREEAEGAAAGSWGSWEAPAGSDRACGRMAGLGSQGQPPKARSRLEHKFDDIPKDNPLTPQIKYCNEMYVLSVVSILASYLSWKFFALQNVFPVLL